MALINRSGLRGGEGRELDGRCLNALAASSYIADFRACFVGIKSRMLSTFPTEGIPSKVSVRRLVSLRLSAVRIAYQVDSSDDSIMTLSYSTDSRPLA